MNIKHLLVAGLALLSLTACSTNQENTTQSTEGSSTMTSQTSSTNQTSSNTGVDHGTIISNDTDFSQADQDQIIARYEELQQALVDQDMNKLNELLPDDYVAIHITGRRQTKKEWLSDIENGDMTYFHFMDMRYSLSSEGDRVILSVQQRIRANIYGSEGTWSIPGERTFEKIDGQWQIVA